MNLISTAKVFTPILLVSLITACGGGGGGGNSGEDSSGPICNSWEAGAYVQQFNEYLPIAEGSTIYYSASSHSIANTFSYNTTESELQSADIYNMAFPSSNGNTATFLTSSISTEIAIYGIDGPVELDNTGYFFDRLRFDDKITIYNGEASITGSTTASVRILVGNFPLDTIHNIDVEYTITSEDSTASTNNSLSILTGVLPTKKLRADITLIVPPVPLFTTEDTVILLSTDIELAKGMGIVELAIDQTIDPDDPTAQPGEVLYGTLASSENLPFPIWFDSNYPNAPTIALESESTFRTLNGTISAHDYTIANLEELNSNAWVMIEENNSCSYDIELTNGTGLPDELTSLEIVFEDRDGNRMSGNITLQ